MNKLLVPLSGSRNSENPSSIRGPDGYGSSIAQEVMRFMFPDGLKFTEEEEKLEVVLECTRGRWHRWWMN